jgi:para-aminobenzoate synthetase / 4-amino-4-deoxychorismate lyase
MAPEQAVLWLRVDRRAFALVGDWLEGRAMLGSAPVFVAGAGDDPFALLDSQPEVTGEPGIVGGGWVGWLGYRLGGRIERLPISPPAPAPRPGFSLAYYDHLIRFDGERWWFEALWSAGREDALQERLALWRARMQAPPPPRREAALTGFALVANGAEGHISAVDECRRRIETGELFQANLCARLEARYRGDLVDLFAGALPRASPRFGALVDGSLSLSPERFLRRDGRSVRTEPIKGTRRRAGDTLARRAARDALLASPKDAAEHVMIVDLMRNDLGRVCEYGSVVARPPRTEAHAGVWHLVSTVEGRLRGNVRDGDLLRATFPPGSVTGAPKIQAMKVISELEATRRELYTGAIGIASPLAGLDLSVAIRTFETSGSRIWFGAGGGIVADSDPELELAEAIAKAAGPVAAIGGRLVDRPRRPGGRGPRVERALQYGPRPDPRSGVFETILVEHGRAIAAEAHLGRLAASIAQLYDARLDPEAGARVAEAVETAGPKRSRLRLLAEPDGSVSMALSPADRGPSTPLPLAPFVLPGGLGAHKWRDRRLLDALAARSAGAVPLLVDSDGLVLEAAHANIWIVEDSGLVTPPADGRILPGVTRSGLLAADAAARAEAIELERLERADEIFLTSSIAGRRAGALLSGRRTEASAAARTP